MLEHQVTMPACRGLWHAGTWRQRTGRTHVPGNLVQTNRVDHRGKRCDHHEQSQRSPRGHSCLIHPAVLLNTKQTSLSRQHAVFLYCLLPMLF